MGSGPRFWHSLPMTQAGLWLGSISLLRAFISVVCFRSIYIRLLWECLLKKNRKASCVFIALAISCRAKWVVSISSGEQLGKVNSWRPNSRGLTQEPLDRAWIPLHAFHARHLLFMNTGSNKEHSEGILAAILSPGPGLALWDCKAGLLYSWVTVRKVRTPRSSVAPQDHQFLCSRCGAHVFQCGSRLSAGPDQLLWDFS